MAGERERLVESLRMTQKYGFASGGRDDVKQAADLLEADAAELAALREHSRLLLAIAPVMKQSQMLSAR